MGLREQIMNEFDELKKISNQYLEKLKSSFSVSNFEDIINSSDKIYYASIINKYLDQINPISNFLLQSGKELDKGKLNNIVVNKIKELTSEHKTLFQNISNTKEEIGKLEKECNKIEKDNAVLIQESARLEKLVSEKDQLFDRVKQLKELESTVKNDGLIDIEKQVNELSESLKPYEERYHILTTKRDKALKKQRDVEESIQKIIDQTSFIGNTDELFEDIKTKCLTHNDRMEKLQLKEFEDINIRLEFTKETCSEIIDESMHSQLETAKSLLDKVDQKIKNKLEKQN